MVYQKQLRTAHSRSAHLLRLLALLLLPTRDSRSWMVVGFCAGIAAVFSTIHAHARATEAGRAHTMVEGAPSKGARHALHSFGRLGLRAARICSGNGDRPEGRGTNGHRIAIMQAAPDITAVQWDLFAPSILIDPQIACVL